MRDEGRPPADEDVFITKSVALRVVVSYDAGKRQRVEATAIHRFIHGRKVAMKVGGRRKRYCYPGLAARRGVEIIGQSVLLMREKEAEDFAAFLHRLRVPFTTKRVWVE